MPRPSGRTSVAAPEAARSAEPDSSSGIESDSDLVGWGEGTGGFATNPNAILSGAHVSDIEKAIGLMDSAGIPRGPMSGVEMALWDLLGKHAGLPLCRLMGGIVRTEVDFTACMGLKEPEAVGRHGPRIHRPVGVPRHQDESRKRPRAGPGHRRSGL